MIFNQIEMKMNLEQEHEKIKRQSDKLTEHDKQLMATQEQLRKKEIEIAGQVQDVKIQTENKYRVFFIYLHNLFIILKLDF